MHRVDRLIQTYLGAIRAAILRGKADEARALTLGLCRLVHAEGLFS